MKSIATCAILSSATPSSLDATWRIIPILQRTNKAFRPRLCPQVHPQVRSTLSTRRRQSCRFLRPPIREATPLAETRARAIERLVAEPLAHRIERGVESRRTHVIEESHLATDLDPRDGDPDQTYRTGPTVLAILRE